MTFDALARDYDTKFSAAPLARFFRFRLAERVEAFTRNRGRVVDLGCGSGEDALWLAASGHDVLAIDSSPAMIEIASAKAAAAQSTARFECRSIEGVSNGSHGSFDVAVSNFGALNCVPLSTWSAVVPGLLRAGGRGFVALLGRHPTSEVARDGWRAARHRRAQRVMIGTESIAVEYPTIAEVRRALSPSCEILRVEGLGALLPAAGYARFATEHPTLMGLLAMKESMIRTWPIVRSWGDHVLFEFEKR